MCEEDRNLQGQNFNAKVIGRIKRRMFVASGIVFSCALFIGLALYFVNLKRAFNFISPKLLSTTNEARGNRFDKFPSVVLWAWERNENLTFLDPQKTGVAFLAKAIFLHGDEVSVKPRLQSLRVAPYTKLIAVVRIETVRANRDEPTATLCETQRKRVAREIVELARRENIAAVQIDFDATLSEREFYRALIRDVRIELPGETALSITALASWCMSDDWIEDLPVDEAVPMLFRMGRERREIIGRLDAGEDFSAAKCRGRAGISTDEADVKFPVSERTYIFHPRAWTLDAATSAINAARETHKEKLYGD